MSFAKGTNIQNTRLQTYQKYKPELIKQLSRDIKTFAYMSVEMLCCQFEGTVGYILYSVVPE